MARIVMTTVGSLGDLHPMFPVADALRKRGHDVQFVVSRELDGPVVADGFPIFPTRLPNQPLAGLPVLDSPAAAKEQIRREYGPYLQKSIETLAEACRGADAIVTSPHQVAAAVVGEHQRLPWLTLTVFPGMIPSSYTVPQPHWLPALPTPAGRLINRATWKVFAYALGYLAAETIDAEVEKYGMSRSRKLFAPGGLSPHLCLVMSSPLYSPRLPDWPQEVKVAGYAEWDRARGWQEPKELREFLDSGPAPVVITVSSAHNAARLLSLAKQALEASGRRGIILTGRASREVLGDGVDHVILDSGIAAYRYVPLSYLLPHASQVIHHAGIGTGQSTILRGLPAVAVPFNFDQWYNASRLRALGVARVVPGSQRVRHGELEYKHVTKERLMAEMDELDRNPHYRARARELGALIAKENGAANACDEIDRLLESWPSRTRPAGDRLPAI